MKKALVLFLLLAFGVAHADILPAGAPVQVVLDEMVDSDDVKTGEAITAHISVPVKHNGKIVFPAGTKVNGVVTKRKNNFIFGVSGKIALGNFKIITEDGVLPLTGNYQRDGNSRVAGALVGGYFLLLPIFIKGQDGKVEAGAESTMYTVQEWEY